MALALQALQNIAQRAAASWLQGVDLYLVIACARQAPDAAVRNTALALLEVMARKQPDITLKHVLEVSAAHCDVQQCAACAYCTWWLSVLNRYQLQLCLMLHFALLEGMARKQPDTALKHILEVRTARFHTEHCDQHCSAQNRSAVVHVESTLPELGWRGSNGATHT